MCVLITLQSNELWVDRISGSKVAVDSLKFDFNTGGVLFEPPRKL